MSKIKKSFILFFVLLALILSLSACADKPNYKGLYFGKYYLNESDESYLEILDDERIVFVNVDFTCIDPESYWGESALWQYASDEIDIQSKMQGEQEYAYSPQLQVLSVSVVEVGDGFALALGFKYNGTNQLKLNKVDFDYVFTLKND